MNFMKKYNQFLVKYTLKIALFCILSVVYTNNIYFAQIKGEKLVLKRTQEPEVKRIEKKRTSAYSKRPIRPKESVEYKITNLPLLLDYKPSDIEAKDISPKFNTDHNKGYFQLGYGTYDKFLTDGNISGKISEEVELGADVHHISTSGLKEEYPWYSRQQNSEASLYLNAYRETGKVNISVDLGYNDYNYYGIYQRKLNPQQNASLEQYYTKVGLKGYYESYLQGFLEDIRIKTYLLKDRFEAKENFLDVKANFHANGEDNKKVENISLNLGVGIKGIESEFSILSKNASSQLFLNIIPELTTFFTGKRDYLKIGLHFVAHSVKSRGLKDDDKLHWFPTAKLLVAPKDEVKFYAGFDGNVFTNTYSDILKENPYVVSDLIIQPTIAKYRIYFGVRGDIGQNIKYDINAGYSELRNALFYKSNNLFQINSGARASYDYLNTFGLIYDDGNLGEVNLWGIYTPINNLEFTGNLVYQSYSLKNLSHAQYKPMVKADLGIDYFVFNRKLNLGLNAIITSRVYANRYELNLNNDSNAYYTSELKDEKISDRIDLNVYTEYKFHKNMSVFVMGNNLTGNLYSKYMGYKVLGAQVLGGLKLEF